MSKEEKYLSLYDFLGRAAGPKLGAEVKKYAVEQGIPTKTKEVPHSGYTGQILTYPVQFLELYFRTPIEFMGEQSENLTNLTDGCDL